MRTIIKVVLFFCIPIAHAQYKCTVGGKSTYSDVPCAANAQHVGALEDRLTADQVADQQRRAAQDRARVDQINASERQAQRSIQPSPGYVPPPQPDQCAAARRELARLREPMVTWAVGRHPDPSGRQQNERLAQIGEAEQRVFRACP